MTSEQGETHSYIEVCNGSIKWHFSSIHSLALKREDSCHAWRWSWAFISSKAESSNSPIRNKVGPTNHLLLIDLLKLNNWRLDRAVLKISLCQASTELPNGKNMLNFMGRERVPSSAKSGQRARKKRTKHRAREKNGDANFVAPSMEPKPVETMAANYENTKYDPNNFRSKYGDSYQYN